MASVIWNEMERGIENYSDEGAGGVGEAERERSGTDGGGKNSALIVHGRQVDQHDDEAQTELDGQRLPLR